MTFGLSVVFLLWVVLPITVFFVTAAYYLARNTVNKCFRKVHRDV